MGPFGPMENKEIKPITVGGNTKGRETTDSIIILNLLFQRPANRPKKYLRTRVLELIRGQDEVLKISQSSLLPQNLKSLIHPIPIGQNDVFNLL